MPRQRNQFGLGFGIDSMVIMRSGIDMVQESSRNQRITFELQVCEPMLIPRSSMAFPEALGRTASHALGGGSPASSAEWVVHG